MRNVGPIAVIIGAIGCSPPAIVPGAIQGSGMSKTEQREAKGFTGISFTGVGAVIVEQGESESVTVTADDNVLPLLETSVADGTLNLGFKSGSSVNTKTPIEFRVAVKSLDKVSVSGAGNVSIKGLKTTRLEIRISGVGNVTAKGSADELDMSLTGTGNFDGAQFTVKKARAHCSGVGCAVVNAAEDLHATVSGVGSIEYLGNPAVTQTMSGIGKIRKR